MVLPQRHYGRVTAASSRTGAPACIAYFRVVARQTDTSHFEAPCHAALPVRLDHFWVSCPLPSQTDLESHCSRFVRSRQRLTQRVVAANAARSPRRAGYRAGHLARNAAPGSRGTDGWSGRGRRRRAGVARDRSCAVAQGGLEDPPCRPPRSSGIRFDSQSVVYGGPEFLFASQVALRRLNRYVPQEKLDLVQFSTR